MRKALRARSLTLWEAFTAFDADDNGVLSPAEVYGAFRWLKLPDLTAEDVVDFVEAAEALAGRRDGVVRVYAVTCRAWRRTSLARGGVPL